MFRGYQSRAIEFLIPKRRGFVQAPAGSGKTIMAAGAAARVLLPGMRCGWLANTREQVEQAVTAIGRVEGQQGVEFDVCCAASLPDFSKCDLVIVDESHHAVAMSWMATLCKCDRVWGFSATPWSPDEERNDALRNFFETFFVISREEVMASGHLAPGKVYMHDIDTLGSADPEINEKTARETERRVQRFPRLPTDSTYCKIAALLRGVSNKLVEVKGPVWMHAAKAGQIVDNLETPGVQQMLQECRRRSTDLKEYVRRTHESHCRWQITQDFLQASEPRNWKAIELARDEAESGSSVLVLVASVEHGELLSSQLPGSAVVHSKLAAKKRKGLIDTFRSGELKILISTSLADEGLDVPRASALVLVCGGRSAAKLEQRAGRVLRPFEGKTAGRIHDFLDNAACFARAQSAARMRVYSSLGYDPEVLSAEKQSV